MWLTETILLFHYGWDFWNSRIIVRQSDYAFPIHMVLNWVWSRIIWLWLEFHSRLYALGFHCLSHQLVHAILVRNRKVLRKPFVGPPLDVLGLHQMCVQLNHWALQLQLLGFVIEGVCRLLEKQVRLDSGRISWLSVESCASEFRFWVHLMIISASSLIEKS